MTFIYLNIVLFKIWFRKYLLSYWLFPLLEILAQVKFLIFFHCLTSLLEYKCFTAVCQFRSTTKRISHTYTHVPISPPSHISLPPTLPIPPLQAVTKHRADLPVLCGCFPLAIYFMFGSVYMSMPLSHFVPAYSPPSPCPQVHSLHLHLYSCPALRFIKIGRASCRERV